MSVPVDVFAAADGGQEEGGEQREARHFVTLLKLRLLYGKQRGGCRLHTGM